jgi:hypothetical protein
LATVLERVLEMVLATMLDRCCVLATTLEKGLVRGRATV